VGGPFGVPGERRGMSMDPAQPKTVLVVDDDAWLRPLLVELLADEGYRVMQAATGAEALDCVGTERPDVVLLDLVLPRGSGLSVLDELRSRESTRGIQVVLVSGECDLFETGLARQATAALHKPLDFTAVLEQLAESSATA
jgi:CheY-like chemotaxis protein